jgi:hypothetical protein
MKILFFISFFLLTACSAEKEEALSAKTNITNVANQTEQSSPVQEKTLDIMKPLAGTDPCFEYVELVRDSNDVETYRSFGDSILLKEDEPARDEQRTYIGIIAAMLKKNSSVAEIRQAVLDSCQELKNQNQLRKK